MKYDAPQPKFEFAEDDAAQKSNAQFAAVQGVMLAYEEIDAAKTDLANFRDAVYRSGGQESGAQRAETARLTERVERKKAAHKKAAEVSAGATDVSSAANDRLLELRRAIGGRKFEDLEYVSVAVKIPAGSTVLDTLATKIFELEAKLRRRDAVKAARLPPQLVEKALIRDVDNLAAQGAIQISGLHGEAKRPKIVWPVRALNAEPNRFTPNDGPPQVVNMEALACRFWRDEIVAEIKTAVAAAYVGPEGDEVFDPQERHKTLRALDAEIDSLQRQVAELTWMAIDAGHYVEFHRGLPAHAILGIA